MGKEGMELEGLLGMLGNHKGEANGGMGAREGLSDPGRNEGHQEQRATKTVPRRR